MTPKNIILIESSPLFCVGLEQALSQFDSNISLKKHMCARAILADLVNDEIDMIVLNAGLLIRERLPLVKEISAIYQVPVLLIFDDFTKGFRRIVEVTEPKGVLKKSATAEEFFDAFISVLSGKTYFEGYEDSCTKDKTDRTGAIESLTKKEKEVLSHIVQGELNKEIAYKMRLSESTVKHHVSKILKKFQLDNRTSIVCTLQTISQDVLATQ